MRRLLIALATMGLTASALAALPAAPDPTLVAVPQLPGGFVMGGTAYYLESSSTHGDLDYASVNLGTTSPFSSIIHNNESDYDWAWGINIGYIFPNTGNDVNLSYFHFSNHATSFVFVPEGAGALSPLFVDPGITAFSIRLASSKVEYDLDQLDLTVGQFIDVGCRLILHPNVGLRWVSLDRKLHNFYFAPTTIETSSSGLAFFNEESDFSGIGPLIGIDASYYIGMGFGAVGHFNSALLIGNIDNNANNFLIPGGEDVVGTGPFFATFNLDNIQRVVPVADGKIGLDYTYMFNNAANSDLTLEVGWQVSHYFNAVDRIVGFAATDSSSILARRTSSFGLSGPYVSLILHV